MSIDYNRVAEIYDVYVASEYDRAFFLGEVSGVEGPVLEIGAGTGRLSVPLLQAGAQLTCLDISTGMLAVLSRKLAALNLDAEVVCGNVCEFDRPDSFDLALFPFQSFMEIVGEENQRAAMRSIASSLRPGGRFICTLHNPSVRRGPVDGALRVVGRFPVSDGSLVVSGFEIGGDPIVNRLQFYELFDKDGVLQSKLLLPMSFELIERESLESMAEQAGFRTVELYGNYDRTPFDPNTSPVLITVFELVTALREQNSTRLEKSNPV